jgi:hypothetical protein
VQPLRGACEVLLLGDGDEGAKLDEVDQHGSLQRRAAARLAW